MRRLATLVSSDGGALARHLGVLSAVVVVLAFRRNLSIEPGVLRLLGAGAAANFACFLAATAGRPRVRALARHVSPLVGIASWAALVRWTGGAALSPFVVALALEIVLAAMAGGWSVITAVTGAAVLALWVQELPGLDGVMLPLGLQSGFLGGTGAVAAAIRRRWGRERRDLSTRLMATERRLGAIEADLLDARRLAQLSTETAALAHSLKNAVHGLLGLARLARSRNGRVPQEEVFGALEEAIGELDGLTRRVLAPARIAPNELVAGEDLRSPLHVAVNRLEEAFPQVSCGFRFEAPPPAVVLSAEVVREVATNLLLNARRRRWKAGERSSWGPGRMRAAGTWSSGTMVGGSPRGSASRSSAPASRRRKVAAAWGCTSAVGWWSPRAAVCRSSQVTATAPGSRPCSPPPGRHAPDG